jgi:IS1 family transposase/transposase-like protein
MTCLSVRCPQCQSEQIGKRGKTRRGKPRYLCQHSAWTRGSFLLDSSNRGCRPEVKHHIIDMSLHASGVRETARVLPISIGTVLHELRKKAAVLESVNTALRRTLTPHEVVVDMLRAGEAEVDAMGSFVGKKQDQRWLWHAIDPCTGAVLASVFGRRQDEVFVQRKALLEPCGLTRFSTDYWGASTRHLDPDVHRPGKQNTQNIERKHLTLRTRMKRLVHQTICCSQSTQRHAIVIGWFVNR